MTTTPEPAGAQSRPESAREALAQFQAAHADRLARRASLIDALAHAEADRLEGRTCSEAADPGREMRAELAGLDAELATAPVTEAVLRARVATETAADGAAVLGKLEARLTAEKRKGEQMRADVRAQGPTALLPAVEAAIAQDRLWLTLEHDLFAVTGAARFVSRPDLHEWYRGCGGDRAPSLQRHVARAPIARPPEWTDLLARLQPGKETP